jgi:hypothetical protein
MAHRPNCGLLPGGRTNGQTPRARRDYWCPHTLPQAARVPPLSKEQQDELRDWRQNSKVKPTAKSDGKGKKQSCTKKQLASLVTKTVKHEMDKSSEELKTQDDTKTYIMTQALAPGTKSQVL